MQVEHLVLEWRRKTSSQKEMNLSNPTILLSEAQAIIRYKAEKEEHLNKLKAASEHLKVFQLLKSHLETRAIKIRRSWQRVFEDLGLTSIPETNREWPAVFTKSRSLKSLQDIVAESASRHTQHF